MKKVIKITSTIALLILFAGAAFMLHLAARSGFNDIDDTAIRITAIYIVPILFFVFTGTIPFMTIWLRGKKKIEDKEKASVA